MTQAVAYLGKGRWFKSFCRVDVVVIWNPALASESEGRNLHMWSSMHWLTSLNVRFLLCLKTCPIQKLLRESSEICLWLCLVGGKENGFQSVVQREVWVGGGPQTFSGLSNQNNFHNMKILFAFLHCECLTVCSGILRAYIISSNIADRIQKHE